MRSLLATALVALVLVMAAAGIPLADAEGDDVLKKAREAQTKVDELQTDHMRQLQELEAKTAEAKVPLFKQRGEVVRNIKNFWKEVFINHPSHANWVVGQDKEILDYLVDFKVEDIGEYQMGFLRHYRITLTFSRENPYFETTELYREIKGIAQGPETKVSGVQWLGGKQPQGPSFFNFFETESGAQGTEQLHDHIYNDMAHVMRYEFWPNPFSYYDLPTNARFAAEHQAHYQASLDQANAGGLPPAEETAAEVQKAMQTGDTPVRKPDTPVSDKPAPTPEEVLALRKEDDEKMAAHKTKQQEKEIKEDDKLSASKSKKVDEKKVDKKEEPEKKQEEFKKDESNKKRDRKEPKKEEDKTKNSDSKSKSEAKRNSGTKSGSKSASQEGKNVDKPVDVEGGAAPNSAMDDGF